jgi:uncharacterized protein YjbJ (UPF0337 family)
VGSIPIARSNLLTLPMIAGVVPLEARRGLGRFRACRHARGLATFSVIAGTDFRGLACERQEPFQGKITMDKDRVAGTAKEIRGTLKLSLGKATGDSELQADGQADKIEGKVQNAIGGVKDAVKEALKE